MPMEKLLMWGIEKSPLLMEEKGTPNRGQGGANSGRESHNKKKIKKGPIKRGGCPSWEEMCRGLAFKGKKKKFGEGAEIGGEKL